MGQIVNLLGNGTEIYKFKAKDCETVVGPICLGNISKDWSVDNMKRTGFTGYVYDFSVDMILFYSMILKIFISIWWRKMILYKVFLTGLTVLSSLTNTTRLVLKVVDT